MRWDELDTIISELESNYPDVELEDITISDIYDLILDLQDFSDDPENVDQAKLEKIIEAWSELRNSN